MDTQTWSTIASVIVVGLGIAGYLHNLARGLKADNKATREDLGKQIGKVDTKVDGVDTKVDRTREEVKGEIEGLRTDYRFLSQAIVSFFAHPPEPRSQAQGE